jgi:hypothetical protein
MAMTQKVYLEMRFNIPVQGTKNTAELTETAVNVALKSIGYGKIKVSVFEINPENFISIPQIETEKT